MRHVRWAAECEKAKEDGGPSPVRLTGIRRLRASRARRQEWGRGVRRVVLLQWSYCSRRALKALSEGLECSISRTVADGRAPSRRRGKCMAFKRSRVRLPSAPSFHGPRVLGCESVAAVATTPPFSAPRGDLAASPCSLAGMVATSSMRSGTGRRARVARAMQGRRRRRGARGAPPVRGGA